MHRDLETVHRSSITRARAKISWTVFESLFQKVVETAYELFPQDECYLWEGMSVFAFDGSNFNLPASQQIRDEFDPDSGLSKSNRSKGHYPQCLITTVYDVFRRYPVGRTITSIPESNERKEALKLIPSIPEGNVLLFDKGYPSYEFLRYLTESYRGYFVLKNPISSTFKCVDEFRDSRKKEGTIHIKGPGCATNSPALSLRAIRIQAKDGTASILITNLPRSRFAYGKIQWLYSRRWEIETHYRNEKMSFEIEKFHTRTVNGVKQELYAILIVMTIARTLTALATKTKTNQKTLREPQLKNAVIKLGTEAFVLIPANKKKAKELLIEIIVEINRVTYYRPRKPRKAQPRYSRQPLNKWQRRRNQYVA